MGSGSKAGERLPRRRHANIIRGSKAVHAAHLSHRAPERQMADRGSAGRAIVGSQIRPVKIQNEAVDSDNKAYLMVAFGGFTLAIGGLLAVRGPVSERPVSAQIIRFGAAGNTRFNPGMTTVVAATPDGLVGTDSVPYRIIAEKGCKVGDAVSAKIRGSSLTINARTCRRAENELR